MKKYSSETAISILAMIQAGIYTIGEICAAHNINRRTFTRWRAKYPKFAQAIEDLRIDAIDKMNIEARNGLMKRLKGCDIQIVAVKRDNKGNIIFVPALEQSIRFGHRDNHLCVDQWRPETLEETGCVHHHG